MITEKLSNDITDRDTNDRFMIVHTVFSITISSSQQGVLFAKLALTGPHFGGFVSDVT